MEDSTFHERLQVLTEYIIGFTDDGEHKLAGVVYKEEFSDHIQVEIVPESHPHITVTWIEVDGIIEKVGAFCTGYELPFVAFPPPTMLIEQ